jgi:hypothetical protein
MNWSGSRRRKIKRKVASKWKKITNIDPNVSVLDDTNMITIMKMKIQNSLL